MKKFIRKYCPDRVQSFLRKLYYRVPVLRKLYYLPADVIDFLFFRRGELRPPRSRIFIGDGHFEEIGREFLGYFIDIAGLKPHERVLEVGCGVGRMALPLTNYLKEGGEYEGFDIVRQGISWCQEHITPRFPNFRFQLADVYNNLYNAKGKYRAEEYEFPFADNHFDFVFLTSVFTHMLPRELENYLAEIGRVLKGDGRTLMTFFLLNEENRAFVESGGSKFNREFQGCRVIDKNLPEAAIAYEEEYIRDLFQKYELEILEPIYYGSWCRRKEYLSSQDIVLAKKFGACVS